MNSILLHGNYDGLLTFLFIITVVSAILIGFVIYLFVILIKYLIKRKKRNKI